MHKVRIMIQGLQRRQHAQGQGALLETFRGEQKPEQLPGSPGVAGKGIDPQDTAAKGRGGASPRAVRRRQQGEFARYLRARLIHDDVGVGPVAHGDGTPLLKGVAAVFLQKGGDGQGRDLVDIDQIHQKLESFPILRAVEDKVAGIVEDAAAIAPEKLTGHGDQAFVGLALEEETVGEVKFVLQGSDLEQIGKGAGGRQTRGGIEVGAIVEQADIDKPGKGVEAAR